MSVIAMFRQLTCSPRPPIQVAVEKENGRQEVDGDRPPKLAGFFVAVDYTAMKARQGFPSTCRYHSTEKKNEPNREVTYLRMPPTRCH
jgi:hypothetical protein